MKHSEQLSDLFTALANFQGQLETAKKSKEGHGYNYADLANCITMAKEPLKDNGLSVSQMIGTNESGANTMITMLCHASGQFISSEFIMIEATLNGGAGKNPAQILGAAITYQRRYAFAAIIGLSQEDDDAKGISGKNQWQNNQGNQWQNQQQRPQKQINQQPQQRATKVANYVVPAKSPDQLVETFTEFCIDSKNMESLQKGFKKMWGMLPPKSPQRTAITRDYELKKRQLVG